MAILLPAAVLGAAAAAATQVQIAADGAPIPIAYGRVRLGARIFAVAVLDADLILGCLWGVGPIDAVESIEIDDAAPHASVQVVHYLGLPGQGVDPTLAAAISGYADTLTAVVDGAPVACAYSVLRIPPRLGTGFPRIGATVRGRPVWDPRENLVRWSDDLSRPEWAGYYSKPAITVGVSDPWGGLTACRLASADKPAAPGQYFSGVAIITDRALAAGQYVVSVYARCVSGTLMLAYGLADGYASTAPLTTAWSLLECTVTIPMRAAGTTVFEAYEYSPANPAWEIAAPQVRRLESADGFVRTTDQPVTPGSRWTRNPALCAGDFIAGSAYGQGLTVVDDDLGRAAAACDEWLADGLPRRTLDLALEQELPAAQWADVLATYAGCWLAREGSAVRLVPDRPASPTRSLSAADLVEGTLRLQQRSLRDTPTVVVVEWTDTTTTPWRMREASVALPGVALGTAPRREERVSLPGITVYAQAYREASERLASAQLPLEVESQTFDQSLADQRGDVVTLTHPIGLAAQALRLTDVRLVAPGRWALTARQYSATVYSDSVATDTGVAPARLPGADTVAPPTAVAVQAQPVEVLPDGRLRAPVLIRWLPSTDAYLSGYDVEWRFGAGDWQPLGTLAADRLDALGYTTPGVAVDARVRAVSASGLRSAWSASSATAAEKTTPPGNVQGLTWDGEALTWLALADADLAGYLVRWQQGRRVTWADGVPMHDGVVGDVPWRPQRLPSGPVTLLVCGLDTSGLVSQQPAVLVLDLPAPALANVLEVVDFAVAGWPGTLTGGSGAGGVLLADSTTAYWLGDALPAWTYDSDAAWPAAAYAALTYAATPLRLAAASRGERVTVEVEAAGETWSLEYRWDSPGPYWTLDAEAVWTDDGAAVWGVGGWQPWPGSAQARAEALELRVRIGAGATQGVLSTLTVRVDTPDRSAVVADVAIAASGSRVPLPAPGWRALRAVVGTFHGTGTAAALRVLDRDAGAGPLVQAFDSSGGATSAVADFHLTGF